VLLLVSQRVTEIFDKIREAVEQYSGVMDIENKIPDKLLEVLRENKIHALTLSENYGGLNLGIQETIIFLRLIGSISPALGLSLMVHYQVCEILKKKELEEFLSVVSSRNSFEGLGITELSGGSDISKIETIAKVSDDSIIINGQKSFVTNALYADFFAILARVGAKELGLIIVEKKDGVEVGPTLKLIGMRGSGISRVIFRDAEVPKKNLIATGKEALKLTFHALNFGRIATGAISIGVADRLLSEMMKWINVRELFGKKLSDNEYVQQRIADITARAEAAWLATIKAAEKMDAGEDARFLASISKLEASKVAMDTAVYAMQLLASHAYIQGSIIEKFYRDVKALEIMEGANEVQRMLIFRELMRRFKYGEGMVTL